jgi:hypothetical protein
MNNTAPAELPGPVQPASSFNDDPLFTRKNAAAYLGLKSEKTLDSWRSESRRRHPELTPTFIGGRVFYRKSVLDSFIKSRTKELPVAVPISSRKRSKSEK